MTDNNIGILTGVDLCSTARIEKAFERHGDRFLHRVFTDAEIAYCSARKNPYPSYAARFAAKEAGMKLLGTGMVGAGFSEIEVVVAESGKPSLKFHGRAKALAKSLNITKTDVSLSHEEGMAIAMAVALTRGAAVE